MSYVACRVLCKEALPPGFPHRALIYRGTPVTEHSFTVSRSPQEMNPLKGSPMGPLWREMPVSKVFYLSLRVPSNGAVPPVTLAELP